jgi:precorrin-3B methylase
LNASLKGQFASEGRTEREYNRVQGSLTVVGIGIKLGLHLTAEARQSIEEAEAVFFLASDPVAYFWIPKLNAKARSLHTFYKAGKDRSESYDEMAEYVLSYVKRGLQVCMVSYGHPGVLSTPLHAAVRRARAQGFLATMQPAVSAVDCLFADLGFDPGMRGCLIYEATDFLIRQRVVSLSLPLILWQIGIIGEQSFKKTWKTWSPRGLRVLCEVLAKHYGPNHEVVVYEAAHHAITSPRIERLRIDKVPESNVTVLSTLYVPPKISSGIDAAMCRRLGIPFLASARKSSKA